MMAFKAGDTVFIVESNRFIREAEVRSCTGGIYLIKFKDNGGGIKLKEHRLLQPKPMQRRVSLRQNQSTGRHMNDKKEDASGLLMMDSSRMKNKHKERFTKNGRITSGHEGTDTRRAGCV